MCAATGPAHIRTQVEYKRGDGAAQKKGGDVCGNKAAHTQVGTERGAKDARIKGRGGVWQRDHTYSGRAETWPRGRANTRKGCAATGPHTLRLRWERNAVTGPREKIEVGGVLQRGCTHSGQEATRRRGRDK